MLFLCALMNDFTMRKQSYCSRARRTDKCHVITANVCFVVKGSLICYDLLSCNSIIHIVHISHSYRSLIESFSLALAALLVS